MATAVDDFYSAASGETVYAGLPGPPARTAVFVGDSLTEHNYGVCPWYWLNALLSAPLKIIHNCGHSGQTVSGMVSQLELDWIDLSGGPTGLIGMPNVGWAFLRLGTNTARGAPGSTGVPLAPDTEDQYIEIIDRLLEVSRFVVLTPIPPIDGNTAIQGYNDFLQSIATSDATDRIFWLDDMSEFIAAGEPYTGLYVDGIHFSDRGIYTAGLTGAPLFGEILDLVGVAYPSQLITDPADVYPAQPQWVVNPLNIGTGGSVSTGITGTLPDDVQAVCTSGVTATVAIVSADVDDTNETPWVRVTPTVSVVGSVSLTYDIAGRTVTSSDPIHMDQIAEIRFNSVDPARIKSVNLSMQVKDYQLPKPADLKFGGYPDIIDGTFVLQQDLIRKDANAGGSSTVMYATFNIALSTSYTGSMGSIDVRCYSNRG